MARFVYSMQSILNIKEKEEAQYRMDFAVAKRKLDDENELLLNLIKRRKDYEEAGVSLREKAIDVVQIRENERAIEVMNDKIALQQIKDRDYYRRYMNSGKKIFLIGVSFDPEVGQIDSWTHEAI